MKVDFDAFWGENTSDLRIAPYIGIQVFKGVEPVLTRRELVQFNLAVRCDYRASGFNIRMVNE